MSGKRQQICRRSFLKWVVMLTCTAVVLFPGPAMAEPGRITRGDVEAVLEASPTGGLVVLLQAGESAGVHAAPADRFGSNGAIKPYEPWDGARFCVDDWHVILMGIGIGGDESLRRQEAEEYLSLINLTFTLALEGESMVLDTARTAIKPLPALEGFPADMVYGFQEGVIVSPDELGVGEYTLTVDWKIDGDSFIELSSRFFIDPSDSATCTE